MQCLKADTWPERKRNYEALRSRTLVLWNTNPRPEFELFKANGVGALLPTCHTLALSDPELYVPDHFAAEALLQLL